MLQALSILVVLKKIWYIFDVCFFIFLSMPTSHYQQYNALKFDIRFKIALIFVYAVLYCLHSGAYANKLLFSAFRVTK